METIQFDPAQLKRVIELHEKSYLLLQWINRALQEKKLTFPSMHKTLSMQAAAEEWIGRNLNGIPPEVRPDQKDLTPFSHLFVSFLTTSYDLKADPDVYRTNDGCNCSFCSSLVRAHHLQVKNLTSKASGEAHELKRIYLSRLVEELGAPSTKVKAILEDRESSMRASVATYGHELMRRSEFAGQGQGVLYLWHDIAWEKNKPKKDFKLSAQAILEAQNSLIQKIKN